MKINYEPKLDFDDVLLVPHRSRTASRYDIKLVRNFSFYHSDNVWEGVPIFAANMDTTGSLAMSKTLAEHAMPTCLHKHYEVDDLVRELYYPETQWYSIGIKDADIFKLNEFKEKSGMNPNICIDVANGYTDDFVDFCNRVRRHVNKHTIIMAGNVCTPEMVQELILHGGVDIVKIGIGPGSACTTRLKTGVGFPQLSAIIECSHAAHGLRNGDGRLGLVCADGGCRTPSDVCKAFAAGADFVMLGGMLAGSYECEGDWQYEWVSDGKHDYYHKMVRKSLKFYGMSSSEAQSKYGGVKDYRASEGRVKEVPYKGPAKDIILDVLGGLRSACAYMGATKLKDMNKCAEFNLVNRTHFDQSV